MLPLLAINAVLMMATAAGLVIFFTHPALNLPPQAINHIALALGILPLILAAMTYFIPVLTRSGAAAPRWLPLLPFASWLGGLILIFGFSGLLQLGPASHGAFLLAAVAALALLLWSWQRGRKTVGRPHPGLNWYLAALICLLLALLAVPLMSVWPAQRLALRLFHMHLNMLGFVGLTAIGTLQVLLPTAAGKPDPQAAQRLHKDLPPTFGGVLLIALGAAWLPPLALVGGLLYLLAPLRMLRDWLGNCRQLLLSRDGAAPALAAAALGLLIALGLGLAHGSGLIAGRPAIAAFIIGFLLPLVSAAATQLLPVWLRPGPQRDWHKQVRSALGWLAGPRSLLMLAAGLAIALEWRSGLWLLLASLLLLLLAALRAWQQGKQTSS